jgi:N utilization substance protein A
MLENTKLTGDELKLMSIFESVSGASAMDCIIDDERVTFLVEKQEFPKILATGRGLSDSNRNPFLAVVNHLSRIMRKRVEIVKFSDDVTRFLEEFFSLARSDSVNVVTRPDGSSYAVIYAHPKRKGAIIGRGGSRAEQGRELARRYFDLQTIYIK